MQHYALETFPFRSALPNEGNFAIALHSMCTSAKRQARAVAGKGKAKKRKTSGKRKMKVTGIPAASSFAVLLEESGVYEDKLPEPHYLSVETDVARTASPRTFCAICGNFATYRCVRCREPFCNIRCYHTHNELRCIKFGL
jgi:HIT zinc finger